MASRADDRRVPSPEGALRAARSSLNETISHLKVVAERYPSDLMRSDARIAIEAIETLLRENLRERDET